jgi:hypothetical protein
VTATSQHLYQYLYSQFVSMKLANVITNGNNLLEKLSSMIYGLSVINLQMNLLTEKARKKKTLPTLFCQYFHRCI